MSVEIRDREKTMRGLKRKRTPALSGLQNNPTFIRPHEVRHGRTPAEAAGISELNSIRNCELMAPIYWGLLEPDALAK